MSHAPLLILVEWQEKLTQADVAHQLEPGEKPFRVRSGILVNSFWAYDVLRSGASDAHVKCLVYDENTPELLSLRLTDLRVVKQGHGGIDWEKPTKQSFVPLGGTERIEIRGPEIRPDRMLAKAVVCDVTGFPEPGDGGRDQ